MYFYVLENFLGILNYLKHLFKTTSEATADRNINER